MRVNWADEARADLRDILDYLYRTFGSKARRKALVGLKRSIRLLKHFPLLGKPCFEDTALGLPYRVLVSKYYQLVYYIEDDTLIIVALWDSRKDPGRLRNRLNESEDG